jgi:hypothetical protein
MTDRDFALTRRSAMFATVASLLQTGTLVAGEKQVITVHKDPTCGCCSGWVEHLQRAGFETKVLDTKDLDGVKQRLGVPESPPVTRRRCQPTLWKDTFQPPR